MIRFFGLDRQYTNLKDELLSATNDAMKDGILVRGPNASKLENWLALRTRCEYAILCHCGTQALEIVAKFLTYHNYDAPEPVYIRVPDLTYVATVNAFINSSLYINDCTHRDFEVELADVDKFGIMPKPDIKQLNVYSCYVGLYGAPTSGNHSHNDIIDGAQHWLSVTNGDVGLAMTISFDPTKNLPASGNGGAIVTNNRELYEFALAYRSNGNSGYNHGWLISGTNSMMSEIDCAHVLVRIQYLNGWQERRKQIRKYYLDQFKDLPFRCLSENYKHTDHKFVIALDQDRNLLREHLYKHKIETKIHYEKTLSELPACRFFCKTLDFLSVSTMLSRSVLSLPIYPELTDNEVEHIARMVKAFY
jgi:dTDP-4-amino-4,6-dideoxygalactose transaminase